MSLKFVLPQVMLGKAITSLFKENTITKAISNG